MPKIKFHRCKYSHCKHETKDISPEDEIKVGESGYWHKDCYEESIAIREVIDIFYKEVNPNVIMNNLRNVVNQMVYKKGCDAHFLKFALRYWLDHGKKLNYPAGLYYVIQDKDAQKAWENKMNAVFMKTVSKELFIGENKKGEKIKDYKATNKSSFTNILGRG